MKVINLLTGPVATRQYHDSLMWKTYRIEYTDPPHSKHDWVMDEEHSYEYEVYLAQCSCCGYEILKSQKGWRPNITSSKKFGAEYIFDRTCEEVIEAGKMIEALS